MKKIFAKLMNYVGTRENLSATHFRADQKGQADLARDRLKQTMESRGDRKYVSETIPEGQVERQSDEQKEHQK